MTELERLFSEVMTDPLWYLGSKSSRSYSKGGSIEELEEELAKTAKERQKKVSSK